MYFEGNRKTLWNRYQKQKNKRFAKRLYKILYGTGNDEIDFEYTSSLGTRKFKAPFEGVIPTLERRHNETKSQGMRDFYRNVHE